MFHNIAIIIIVVCIYQRYKKGADDSIEIRPKRNTGWNIQNRQRNNTTMSNNSNRSRSNTSHRNPRSRSNTGNRSVKNTGYNWDNSVNNWENPADYSTGRNLEMNLYHSKSGNL